MLLPLLAQAQPQPTSLSVSPGSIYHIEGTPWCYNIVVGNGNNMTVDVRYKFDNGPDQVINAWPQLDAYGRAYICTDSITEVGSYTFTGVRNNATGGVFVTVSATLTVQAEPPQATGLSFATSSGYAGINSYTLTAANEAMNLDVEYTLNCSGPPPGCPVYTNTIALNANGSYTHTLLQQQVPGIYYFRRVRNTKRRDWVTVSATYTIKPPLPTSLSITPSSVIAGHGSYLMLAGNGKQIFLNAKYRFTPPGGSEEPEAALPFPFWLNAANQYSDDGYVAVFPDACTTPVGAYRYTWITNRDLAFPPYYDATGTTVSATVAVTPPQAPTFNYVSPNAGFVGQNVSATIEGNNLCGATLSTSYPGLSFSNVTVVSFHTITATFAIAGTAAPGNATVMLTTPRGTASFSFAITIQSPPTISSIAPTTASAGSSVPVTISGANLAGATLSTNYSGLSFSNITSTNTSISAQFNIAQNASAGTANVIVRTLSGEGSVGFGITASGGTSTGPATTKEYVYLGGRVLAVETWAAATQPPSAPEQLPAEAANQNTVHTRWNPAIPAPDMIVSKYRIIRGGAEIATVDASQTSYTDTTVSQGTAYTYTIKALDNTIPVPLVSASSNAVTVTTPAETTPPSTPAGIWIACDPCEAWWLCYAEWQGSTDTGGSGLAGYAVTLYGNGWNQSLGTTGTNSILFETTELNGLAVVAYDNAGNYSAPGWWSP